MKTGKNYAVAAAPAADHQSPAAANAADRRLALRACAPGGFPLPPGAPAVDRARAPLPLLRLVSDSLDLFSPSSLENELQAATAYHMSRYVSYGNA